LVEAIVTATELLLIGGMAAAVFVPKALPLLVVSEHVIVRLRRWLEYVAPAILGALVAPSILAPSGQPAAPAWDQAAYAIAFVVALLTRKMIPSLAAGLVTLAIVTLLHP
jgi:branched-subunit amino acid transport protein